MAKPLNVGLIGYGFMGRAHSNAYAKVNHFFDLAYRPVLKAVCARSADKAKAFAELRAILAAERLKRERQIGLSDWYAIAKVSAAEQAALLGAKLNGANRDELESRSRKARNGSSGRTTAARMPKVRIPLANDTATGVVTVAGESIDLALSTANGHSFGFAFDDMTAGTHYVVVEVAVEASTVNSSSTDSGALSAAAFGLGLTTAEAVNLTQGSNDMDF